MTHGHSAPGAERVTGAQLQGRVCVVTGASGGIGRATALGLARLGATLALVCRDRGRGEAVIGEVAAAAGSEAASLFLADLSSQREIRRLAEELCARHAALHVLVNNAGIVNTARTTTVDGIETVFAVNHLAYFLLTHLLLDRLRAGGRARIVNVASEAHRFAKRIELDEPPPGRRYRPMRVYGHSKLANLLFTVELSRRLAGSGVTANACHPGAVATGLGRQNGRLARLAIAVLRPFFRTPERGAATSIYLAASPAVEGVTGRYFIDCREAVPAPQARDVDAARRLWERSALLTGLVA
jgi:NAD(P)-dependent dehydrogenase (short-subunit alcohol dehydrogenase family)